MQRDLMKQTWRLTALPSQKTCRPCIFRLSRKKFMHKISWLDSRRTTSRTCSSKKFLRLQSSNVGKRVSKNSSESMRWIEEVEMATSVDDLQTSRSISGKLFPNLEALDAMIASSLKKTSQIRTSGRGSVIYEHFRVTTTHVAVLEYSDLFQFFSRF